MKHGFIWSLAFLLAAVPCWSQDPPEEPAEKPAAGDAAGEKTEEGEKKEENKSTIKPYDKVVTEDAVTDEGIFKVHRIKDKVLYEIPATEIGPVFLLVTQIAKTTEGAGHGGQALGRHVVRWERHGERVFLRNVSYDMVADPALPVARAVEAANNDSIIMAFAIQALGENDAPVIDVSPLFTTEVPEFSARSRIGAKGFDAKRSYVEDAKAFPTNIEVRATQTFTAPPSSADERPSTTESRRPSMRPGSATIVVSFSMVKLPEKPMMPRLFDDRVGYFSVSKYDFGTEEHKASERKYITRWRLEKKVPEAELSEPVAPIVYWVDPATPAKWRPYIIKAIEDWQPAFEAAGFKNAIIAKQGPTPEEDPDWSPEDARNSVIRWLPSTVQNASGPHINDPRTGEILESDIQLHHNVLNLVRNWYFTQVSPLDPRAQKLPLPDDLMGELLRYVVVHEIGHTLGFQHNMKASSMYPADKVRDKQWVHEMGHTPTLMDYSRFNYVAQPEDGIAPEDLIPKIGPYDKWATMWGYTPIPSAATPDDELPTLNQWALEQDEKPWLRFTTVDAGSTDPGQLTEAVGDADAVASTTLGIRNLERVAANLVPATSTHNGEPYDDLEELYGNVVGQWSREIGHVCAIIGGFQSQEKYVGQRGPRFVPISRERQAGAVAFLNEQAFHAPDFFLNADVLRRIEPNGVVQRVGEAQRRVLETVLANSRIERLVEQTVLDGESEYTPTAFLNDVRSGVWSELQAPSIAVDAFRRNLQRAYVDIMAGKLNDGGARSTDVRAFARGELVSLKVVVGQALLRAADRETQLHLDDVYDRIERALDPSSSGQPATTARAVAPEADELGCWPDYNDELR